MTSFLDCATSSSVISSPRAVECQNQKPASNAFRGLKQFCTKEGLNFKLLADTDHKVSSDYDSVMSFGEAKVAARHTFIINPEGKIAKVYTEVNPNRHSAEVLAALTELQK